jgi:hypothetical protein
MKLKALFIQRVEPRPGQHGPELVYAVDEFTEAINGPGYFHDNCEMMLDALDLADSQIAGRAVVEIEVDTETIRRLCCPPEVEAIEGKIVGSEPG